MPASIITCFSNRSWSSVSRIEKFASSPTSPALRRSIFAATEWKVPRNCMPSATGPIRPAMRWRISRAALLVKVTASTSDGHASRVYRM